VTAQLPHVHGMPENCPVERRPYYVTSDFTITQKVSKQRKKIHQRETAASSTS